MIRGPRIVRWLILSLTVGGALLSSPLRAQDPDELNKEELNEQKVEQLATGTESEMDYSDLLQDMDFYLKHPLNLNTASAEDLASFIILSEIQISNLLTHIAKNGKLLSVYELQSIDGFDVATIQALMPYVKVSNEGAQRFNFRDALQYGSHDLFLRYQRVLEQQQGYSPATDEELAESPNSRYLGSADKYYLRYRYKFFNKISMGITAEKDAGEQFFAGAQKYGFDFYSAHLMVNNLGIVKSAVVGDYHVQFGQGLTLWTGMGFGKSSDVINIKKMASGLRAFTSADENRFMRGAAVCLAKKGIEFTAFYSIKKIDANGLSSDTTSQELQAISSLQESGLHSTPSEVEDRKSLTQQLFGGHLAYRNRRLNVGVTAAQTLLGAALQPNTAMYNQFGFQGSSLLNLGLDYSYIIRNFNFFGEFSYSGNGGFALLDGIMMSPDPHVSISLLYRNYRRNYAALYSSAFAESSTNANEEGLFFGLALKFSRQWNLNAYCDYYRFDWLKFTTSAPSRGQDYMAQLNYRPSRKLELYLKYRYEIKGESMKDDQRVLPYNGDMRKQSLRFNVSVQVSPSVTLKNRVEYVMLQAEGSDKQQGYLIYQDVRFKPPKWPVSLSTRYALFHTDSYDARLYAYENDVLYAYSIPAYYYKGWRFYLMAKVRLHRHVDFWIRYAITNYTNKDVISSGLTEIQGSRKSEIKAQLRLKF